MSPTIERYLCLGIAAVLAVVAVQPWAKGAETALASIAGILTGKELLPSGHAREAAKELRKSMAPPPAP